MRNRLLAAAIIVGLTLILSPAVAGASVITHGLPFPPTNLRGATMVLDPADNQILVSGGDSSSGIAVLGFDGVVKRQIADFGASGMVIDNGSLYVGHCGDNTTITVYDTATLAVTGSISAGDTTACHMAIASGKLWVADGVASPLESITLDSAHTATAYPSLGDATYGLLDGPVLITSTAAPDRLVLINESEEVSVVDTSDGSLLARRMVSGAATGAISPDGADLVLAGHLFGAQRFSLETLTPGIAYTLPVNPDQVTIAPDGTVVTLSSSLSALPGNMRVFSPSAADAIGTVAANRYSALPGGLSAYSPDGSHLYVVGKDPGTRSEFDVYDAPGAGFATGLSLAPLQGVWANTAVTITGRFSTMPDGGEAGRTIHLVLTDPQGAQTEAGQTTTAADGTFSFVTPALQPYGRWTITARFDGADGYLPSAYSIGLTVSARVPGLTLTPKDSVVTLTNQTVTLTAQLASFSVGQPVSIHWKPANAAEQVREVAVGGGGKVTETFVAHVNGTFWATVPGDAEYMPQETTHRSLEVLPIIKERMSRPAGYSGPYRLYHYNATCARSGRSCPQFTETTTAMGGKNVYMVIEQHLASGWKAVASYRRTLNSRSTAVFPVRYGGASVIGKNYRLLAVYKGDPLHGAVAWGAWYFRITRAASRPGVAPHAVAPIGVVAQSGGVGPLLAQTSRTLTP